MDTFRYKYTIQNPPKTSIITFTRPFCILSAFLECFRPGCWLFCAGLSIWAIFLVKCSYLLPWVQKMIAMMEFTASFIFCLTGFYLSEDDSVLSLPHKHSKIKCSNKQLWAIFFIDDLLSFVYTCTRVCKTSIHIQPY